MSNPLNQEMLEAAGFSAAADSWAADKFGAILLSSYIADVSGDVTAAFNALVARMNSERRPLLIDKSINVSGFTTISGYCVMRCTEDAWINITAGAAGIRAENSYVDVGAWTAVPSLVTSPDATGSVVSAITVEAAAYAALSVGDLVYLKDSVTNSFSYNANTTSRAELATVIEKRADNLVILSHVLGDAGLYSASGRVFKVGRNPCDLRLKVRGELTTPRAAVRIEGYERPYLDLNVDGNSSMAAMVISCFGGGGRVRANDLVDNSDGNAYGYAVATYGACVGMDFEVHAERVRHAATDGIIDNNAMRAGVSRNNSFSGVAIDCSAASWDTHPNSDGQRFINIKAWGTRNVTTQSVTGLNYALQMRGTNVVVDGLHTNLRKGISYSVVAVRNSAAIVRGLSQDKVVSGTISGINTQHSIAFQTKTGTGTHSIAFVDCPNIHIPIYAGGYAFDFDRYRNCHFDLTTTASPFPARGTVAGAKHIYERCTFRDPPNFTLASTDAIEMVYCVIRQSTTTRNCQAGAGSNFKFFGCGIILEGGGNLNSSAFVVATGAGVTGQYAGLWVSDGRAAGVNVAFSDGGFTGHSVSNRALA